MSLERLKEALPEIAKDIKLNLSAVLTEEDSMDLKKNQIGGVALACAYSTKNIALIQCVQDEFSQDLTEAEISAAKSSAIMMAMTNVYYRFTHLVSDKAFSSMPAKLRMNAIGQPGIDKIDFELNCLAVSILNGCGMCIDAHVNALVKAGVSKQAIQSSARIAAVLNAAALALDIGC